MGKMIRGAATCCRSPRCHCKSASPLSSPLAVSTVVVIIVNHRYHYGCCHLGYYPRCYHHRLHHRYHDPHHDSYHQHRHHRSYHRRWHRRCRHGYPIVTSRTARIQNGHRRVATTALAKLSAMLTTTRVQLIRARASADGKARLRKCPFSVLLKAFKLPRASSTIGHALFPSPMSP